MQENYKILVVDDDMRLRALLERACVALCAWLTCMAALCCRAPPSRRTRKPCATRRVGSYPSSTARCAASAAGARATPRRAQIAAFNRILSSCH